jgi:predicted transposase YdaD
MATVPAARPHDAFFRGVFGQVEQARGLYRCALPRDLVEAIDRETLEPVSPDFIDAKLADHHADVLFTARLRGGGRVRVYFLTEHKSNRDPDAEVQQERYISLIFERHRQLEPDTVPAVIALVVHHGRRP